MKKLRTAGLASRKRTDRSLNSMTSRSFSAWFVAPVDAPCVSSGGSVFDCFVDIFVGNSSVLRLEFVEDSDSFVLL